MKTILTILLAFTVSAVAGQTTRIDSLFNESISIKNGSSLFIIQKGTKEILRVTRNGDFIVYGEKLFTDTVLTNRLRYLLLHPKK